MHLPQEDNRAKAVSLGFALPILLVCAGLFVGCGSTSDGTEEPRSVESVSRNGVDNAGSNKANLTSYRECQSCLAIARSADRFVRALASDHAGRAKKATSGRFSWFSIDAPPSVVPGFDGYEHFVASSPNRFVQFKRRSGALSLRLKAVALASKPTERSRYSDIAFSGLVVGQPELEMGGKGAMNRDGTVRAWSMGVKGDGTPYPKQGGVCGARIQRPVLATTRAGIGVCLQ